MANLDNLLKTVKEKGRYAGTSNRAAKPAVTHAELQLIHLTRLRCTISHGFSHTPSLSTRQAVRERDSKQTKQCIYIPRAEFYANHTDIDASADALINPENHESIPNPLHLSTLNSKARSLPARPKHPKCPSPVRLPRPSRNSTDQSPYRSVPLPLPLSG